MNKTISGALLAAGIALGAGGSALLNKPAPFVHGLNVARLPDTDGKVPKFATGNVYAADFSNKEGPREMGSRRIDYNDDEKACLNKLMDRASDLFRKP